MLRRTSISDQQIEPARLGYGSRMMRPAPSQAGTFQANGSGMHGRIETDFVQSNNDFLANAADLFAEDPLISNIVSDPVPPMVHGNNQGNQPSGIEDPETLPFHEVSPCDMSIWFVKDEP